MAEQSLVHDKGFMRVTLGEDHAERIYKVMQRAECSPAAALGWLLAIAGAEVEGEGWDASTASQSDAQGLLVHDTNLDRLSPFSTGDTVVIKNTLTATKYPLIGVVKEIDSLRGIAKVTLTEGTRERAGKKASNWEPNYECPTSWLMEL